MQIDRSIAVARCFPGRRPRDAHSFVIRSVVHIVRFTRLQHYHHCKIHSPPALLSPRLQVRKVDSEVADTPKRPTPFYYKSFAVCGHAIFSNSNAVRPAIFSYKLYSESEWS